MCFLLFLELSHEILSDAPRMIEIMERQPIKLGAARFDFSILATLSVHVDFVWATLQLPFHAFIVLHHFRFEVS